MDVRVTFGYKFIPRKLDWQPKAELVAICKIIELRLVRVGVLHKFKLRDLVCLWKTVNLSVVKLHLQGNQLVQSHSLPDVVVRDHSEEGLEGADTAGICTEADDLVNRATVLQVKLVNWHYEVLEVLFECPSDFFEVKLKRGLHLKCQSNVLLPIQSWIELEIDLFRLS